MVVWKSDWKSLFVVENVWYSNDPPSQVTLQFQNQTPKLSGSQMKLGIQMVTEHPQSNFEFTLTHDVTLKQTLTNT